MNMNNFKLRDRDALLTPEGIILRVYGDSYHPLDAWICDAEYASEKIYVSTDPRAPRNGATETFYKFYADGGLQFVKNQFPQYQVFYEPLQRDLVGISRPQLNTCQVFKPEMGLESLLEVDEDDKLIVALKEVLDILIEHSSLKYSDFGVFGSLLFRFHHSELSDLDFVIFGRKKLDELRNTLSELYSQKDYPLRNEFESFEILKKKHWPFENFTLKDYWHYSREKLIYGIIDSRKANRSIKIEFEPIRAWGEITSEYDSNCRITNIGWIKAIARVLDDTEGFFMPSVFPIEIERIVKGPQLMDDIFRVVSFVEEFRGNVTTDSNIIVEGNLEKLTFPNREVKPKYQIMLTYGSNYHQQTLKFLSPSRHL